MRQIRKRVRMGKERGSDDSIRDGADGEGLQWDWKQVIGLGRLKSPSQILRSSSGSVRTTTRESLLKREWRDCLRSKSLVFLIYLGYFGYPFIRPWFGFGKEVKEVTLSACVSIL